MEILDKIEHFVKISFDGSGFGDGSGSGSGDGSGYGSGSGSGDGSGYGSGSGFGDGYGYGSGSGSGDGDGSGSGDGSGYGSGSGDGSGDGDGSGSGDGSGYGYGYGSGYGLLDLNGKKIYYIDEIPTIIISVVKNIAKGFIVNDDFSLKACFIAKGQNMFAHGETAKEAVTSLEEKLLERMDTEEAIEKFKDNFNNKSKYKGEKFYLWHHLLTGSCKMGRDDFIEKHDLDLNKKYSVKEFIKITENAYGGEIIRKLKEYYK